MISVHTNVVLDHYWRCAVFVVLLASGCGGPNAVTSPKPTPAPTQPPKESSSTNTAVAPVASELPLAGSALLDGFEGPEHTVWSFDSADDEAIAEYLEDGKTQGKKALRVTLRDKGSKGKLLLRRDIDLDLSQASAVLFDLTVRVPPPPESTEAEKDGKPTKFSAALALKSHPGDVYQEIKPISLKSGLNRDVRFALEGNAWKNEKTKWEYAGPPVNLKSVHRIMLLIFNGDAPAGSVIVDNLRLEGPTYEKASDAGAAYREWRPEFLQLPQPPPQATNRYETIEVPVLLGASYHDVFDPSDLLLGMRVVTPSGKNLDVRGFFAGIVKRPVRKPDDAEAHEPYWGPFKSEKKSKKKHDGKAGEQLKSDEKAKVDDKTKTDEKAKGDEAAEADELVKQAKGELVPIWMLRFTPQETGRYTLQLYARNSSGETRMPESSMVVAPEAVNPATPGRTGGNVRVSRRDPRFLELQDGSPFYMVGQNVCWTQDWSPYLKKIKEYGGNTCRIWLCPWGCNLEKKSEPGSYDLQEAQRLDALMEQASATGVRIIFCFTFHGMNGDFWNDSPYNAANGGPCGRQQDFFTDGKARRQFKRLLSYAATRWGSSPALLSWELINEMDLARYDDPDDVLSWTRDMAGHLKGADVHGHLVTTSSTNVNFKPELWHERNIDFVSIHGYGKDVDPLIQKVLSPYIGLNKPVILAEFGGGTEAGDDIPDKDGARLQTSLWLTACSPSCGMALPWWWDTYIEARNLYPVMAAAQRFVAGEDRRGRYGEWVRKNYGAVLLSGIMDSQGARLYAHHPGWIKNPETRGKVLFEAPQPLELSGMIDGAYKVEFWSAKEGKAVNSIEAVSREGRLTIELPAQSAEFGLKIDRKQRLRPELK